jgi:hypothetical protein
MLAIVGVDPHKHLLRTVAREREQAVQQLALQLALLADQEREIQHKLERTTSGRFPPYEP